ncbi:MAG TPA: glycosyltransferase family 4 protein [Clostridia bacterium]|nr:glycosyltransferase family 4 protein [Clostridia bacterium]
MKIAFICTEKLPVPPVAGGAIQLYISGILPWLSGRHDITVYGVQHPGLPNVETMDNVKYIRVPGKTDTLYVSSLKAALEPGFDLVHVFNRPRFMLALSDKFPETKFSLSLHNEMFHPEKIPDADALRCVKKAEFINTVSRFIADTVVKRVPEAEQKLRVVYSGADPLQYHVPWSPEGEAIKREIKLKYGLGDRKTVLYVGRLSVKKGVHVLLKAMEKIMSSRKDVALVVVGSKWYGNNEKDDYANSVLAAAKNLPGPVVLTGFVPPSEIPSLYNIGDIFVCASQWNEPLARVHYEAMAAGLPIITTNRGGNAEVVEGYGNGIVINEYSDPSAFASTITQLLDDPVSVREMGMAGRKLAEERFNWERVAAEVLGGQQ